MSEPITPEELQAIEEHSKVVCVCSDVPRLAAEIRRLDGLLVSVLEREGRRPLTPQESAEIDRDVEATKQKVLKQIEDGLREPMQRLIREAVEAEREACAKACEDLARQKHEADDGWGPQRLGNELVAAEEAATVCAEMIRSRGEGDSCTTAS